MSNHPWVCFDCRIVARRPSPATQFVNCATCGQPCMHLSPKIRVPRKRRVAEWEALRVWVQRLRIQVEEKRAQQAREHLRWLRQRIDALESGPRDPAREYLLAKYRTELAERS